MAVDGSGSAAASAKSVASSTIVADLGRQRGLDLVGEDPGVAQLRAEGRQRVVRLRSAASSSSERYFVCWSSERVAGQPGDLGLDERGALAGACPGDRLAGRRVAGQDVRAVDDDARASRSPAARSATSSTASLALRRRHADRVAVVLDDEDERQLVDRRRSSGPRGRRPGSTMPSPMIVSATWPVLRIFAARAIPTAWSSWVATGDETDRMFRARASP